MTCGKNRPVKAFRCELTDFFLAFRRRIDHDLEVGALIVVFSC